MFIRLFSGSQALGPSFRWLLWSDTLMLLSLMVGQVVLPWWIAQEGGAADLALYGTALSAISFIGMPLLSPLGDRHAKRRLIAIGLAAFALATTAIAGVASLGHYHLGALIGLQMVPVLAMAVILPTSASLSAELVPAASLSQALSAQQSAQSLGRMIGPALGGVVLAAVGTALTLWMQGLLLLAAAALASRLPSRDMQASAGQPRAAWWADLRAGVKANWAIPLERGWILVNGVSWMFLFPAFTLLVPLKVQSLGLSAVWLGFCEAALSLGMLAGALGLSAWWARRQGRYATRVTAALLQGCALGVAGLSEHPGVLVAAFAVAGLANSAVVLVGMTQRMLARPLAFRARMAAGTIMTAQMAATLGPALAGLALTHWPVATVHASFGVLGAIASLGLAVVPGFRAFMALDAAEVEGWYGRAYPAAFQPSGKA
ncbi:MAG TPA: MFS transporter [Burkholderiaceae bacterium]|nr:MFS transporter [Burkholderiaceae bacterium]